jgi:hypothetical protein
LLKIANILLGEQGIIPDRSRAVDKMNVLVLFHLYGFRQFFNLTRSLICGRLSVKTYNPYQNLC